MKDEQDRVSSAYHEAGHGAVAMWFGWNIGPEGIEIGENEHCALRRRRVDDTERASVCISLAGPLTEARQAKRLHRFTAEDMAEVLDQLAWGEVEIVGSDDAQVLERLSAGLPDASPDELVVLYQRYEAETHAVLDHEAVWRVIEKIAAVLVDAGHIGPELAHEIADKAGVLYGAGRESWR